MVAKHFPHSGGNALAPSMPTNSPQRSPGHGHPARPAERYHSLVLGRAFTQPERVLRPVDADPQRDHHTALTHVHAVEHQRLDVQFAQIAGHQLGQRGLGLATNGARRRACSRRFLRAADIFPDRLGDRVAARRHPGQHPPHHHLRPAILGGKVGVAGDRHLIPSTGRARGRLTASRRPPRVTEPRPAPWRTAARFVSCLPLGPQSVSDLVPGLPADCVAVAW